MKRLLFITDKFDFEQHSAIDELFNGHLQRYYDVDLVYFSKSITSFEKHKKGFLFPYSKRKKLFNEISLDSYDYVIVRNFFSVLDAALKQKKQHDCKIGFQLSFPHSYRRLHEANITKRATIRKLIEYKIRNVFENRLLNNSDFFLPISNEMVKVFYSSLNIPILPVPLGVNPNNVIQPKPKNNTKVRMLYIGTIDRLRQFDLVLNVLSRLDADSSNWEFDIYTKEKSLVQKMIPESISKKINIKNFVPREILLKEISNYDIGIFLLPNNKLYRVASPTKVMDYYQAGIPCIMSPIPECLELFDDSSAFLTPFKEDTIEKAFKNALGCSKEHLTEMAEIGQKKLLKQRNYQILSERIYTFIEKAYA